MTNEDEFSDSSIDDICLEIQADVEYRRSVGDYPIGLEQQLERYFADMMRSLHERDLATKPMADAILQLNHWVNTFSIDIPPSSRLPGMTVVHNLFAKLSRRHIQNLADQIYQIGQCVLTIQKEFVDLATQIYEHDDREQARVLSSVSDQLAVVEHLSHMALDFDERLRKIERRE